MINFPIEYTKEDLKGAFDLHYNAKFPIRSKLILLLGAVLLATSLGMLVAGGENFPKMKWIFMLMGIFYLGFYFYRKSMMLNMAMKNPTIRDMRSVHLDEQMIRFKGEDGQSELDWQQFEEVVSNENCTLLYISKHNFFILPSRFISEKDQVKLKELTSKIAS